jgi:5-formyltetrahydrofolate cyclo-ligase
LSVHDFAAPREQHRFGYEQPVPTAPEIDPGRIDAVLVPGLCFDRRGGRLGWGRGYYDQLLTRMRPDVWTVGVTLERRIVDSVPSEPHDMKMTMLATEEGLFRCSSI